MPAKTRSIEYTADLEMHVMGEISHHMDALNADARNRVLTYMENRYRTVSVLEKILIAAAKIVPDNPGKYEIAALAS